MAALLLFLQTHLAGVVAVVAAVVLAIINRDKIKEKLGMNAEPDAADEGISLDGLEKKIREIFEALSAKGDSVERAVHLAMLVMIEDDIAALPDSPEKTEQITALQTLAKYRVVSPTPAKT